MLLKADRDTSKQSGITQGPTIHSFADNPDPLDIPQASTPAISIFEGPTLPAPKGANTLTVGNGVTFSGKVIKADNVVLEGIADGEIIAGSVEISTTGSLTGTVNTEHLTVAGGFSGDANVTGNLYVKSTGKVDGKVAYGNLAVEEGGVVLGTLGQDKAQRLSVPPPRQTNKRTSDSDPPDKPITSELP